MAYIPSIQSKENVIPAWTPDLFGPIFRKKSLTLKQAMDLRNVDEQIHRMAAFVPDEVIYADLSEKSLRSFQAVLMFLNISGFSMLFKSYIHNKNGGSLALTKVLNNYIHIIGREVYYSDGDILKFSDEGLLAAWKIRDGQFMFDAVQNVIAHALNIQDSIASLKDVEGFCKVNMAISAGDITFSVIGNDEARHFAIVGLPIEELKNAKKVSLPNDLVISLSAWQHCTPSQYEYVIKDSYNVKIIRMLKQLDLKSYMTPTSGDDVITDHEISVEEKTDVKPSPYRRPLVSIDGQSYSEMEIIDKKEKILTAISAIAATNPNLGTQLKSYLTKPVIHQIEKGEPLRFLAEIRRVTVVSIDIIPEKYSNNELILLVDKCFLLLHSIIMQYGGCINIMNLYERNIFFCIVFGIRGYSNGDQFKTNEICKNGIICAMHILRTVKTIAKVQSAFVGVSTGIAYCGVIGHIARKYYAVIGSPVVRAIRIMSTSYDKVSCDYDTILHSHFKKDQFRSRGMRTFQRSEKYHIYEYIPYDILIRKELETSSLDYCYPILGRLRELEYFNDILNEIGMKDRKYSGLLIEGIERIGKSRLLDAFVISVYDKQIRPIKLSLHATYAEKTYSVIYYIILQILEAEDCETVEEREKELLNKLGDVLALEDFCYLNVLMRVRFPLSDTYSSDTDWRRHMKTIHIFEMILKQLKSKKICILLDDIQHMDYRSWQFLSSALDNYNIVTAMTMPKASSWDDLSHVEAEIYKDKRLMKHMLLGLSIDLLPIFACQFLNVLAIPKKLSRILQKRQDGHIGWCETFLTSILQLNSLDFIKISPSEAEQRDLYFPNSILVTMLPIKITPEELAPPLHWSQMSLLNICDTNENYLKISDKIRDMTEMMHEIYDRMNPYEQDFIKCAAALGRVFKRSVIESVMINSIPLLTSKTVSEMIRMRILECASFQRRYFYSEDLMFCIDKKRQTFSDMHYSLSCICFPSPAVLSRNLLPFYAHCKMLEFRGDSFFKLMDNIQTNEEKKEYHTRAARIYSTDARKCSSCDGGRFLKIFNEDTLRELEKEETKYIIQLAQSTTLIRRRTILQDKGEVLKPTILARTNTAAKKPDTIVCRMFIMPTSIDDKEDEGKGPKNEDNERISKPSKFRKRSRGISPEMIIDPSHTSCLEKFSHIDYRNCHCDNIISHLFWKLRQHVEKSGEIDKMLEFFIEYSAGLIQMQPLYAIKLLSIAAEKSRAAKMIEVADENAEANITNEGIILALMGDAYIALGNYDQAKKYYFSAVKLRGPLPRLKKGICYNVILKVFCKLKDPPRYTIEDEESRHLIVKRVELASYLRRLCVAFMIDNKLKTAQSFALRGFKLVFLSANSFLEKGEVYLTIVRVSYCTRNIKLMRHIERPMLITIRRKICWNDAEEIVMVANIYLAMYQIRVLEGELEKAVGMGIKVLKISGVLHLNKLMLITVPSLIQMMLWTKRINEAIDLMRELYFLADEDIDLSAKTWYYALSLDLMLDAGIVLESYETCYTYYEKIIAYKSKFCLWRDPQSLSRLLTNLWMYELRMGYTATEFMYSTEKYMKDVTWHDFSQILTCCKRLECYLLMLLRCINMKRSEELLNLIDNISNSLKCLKNVCKHAKVIKPRLYLLIAYLNVLQGRKSSTRIYLYKAQKFATKQENQLMMAWLIQNRRTWKEKIYNNMAQYWLEYVGSANIVGWQYICNFDNDTWSTILYPLSTPSVHL